MTKKNWKKIKIPPPLKCLWLSTGEKTYPTWGKGKSSIQKCQLFVVPLGGSGYVSSQEGICIGWSWIPTVDGWNPAPPGIYANPLQNNGINYQPQLVIAGFLPSTETSFHLPSHVDAASHLFRRSPCNHSTSSHGIGIGTRWASTSYKWS